MGRHSQPDGRHSSTAAGRHRADADAIPPEGRHRAEPIEDDAEDTAGLRRALVATVVATSVTAGGLAATIAAHHRSQEPITPTAEQKPARTAVTPPTKDPVDEGAATRLSLGLTPHRPAAVVPGTGYLSSCFCERWGTFHWGIDLAAPYGAPIVAAGDGVVLRAGPATGFGQAVYVQHAGGDTTVYGHMERILVTPGEHVHAGQLIALVGAEGESTGPHLHFEVHKGSEYGTKIDPIPWLTARGVHI